MRWCITVLGVKAILVKAQHHTHIISMGMRWLNDNDFGQSWEHGVEISKGTALGRRIDWSYGAKDQFRGHRYRPGSAQYDAGNALCSRDSLVRI